MRTALSASSQRVSWGSSPPTTASWLAAPSRVARSAAHRRRALPSPRAAGVFFIDTRPDDKGNKPAKPLVDGPAPSVPQGLLPPASALATGVLADPLQPKALPAPAPTVLELIQATPSYQRFNELIEARPFLRDDWRSFINRPWVSGLVAAVLSHREGADMMQLDPDLALAVRGVVASVDHALTQEDLAWMVATLDALDHHSAVYTLMDAAESLVDADAVTWLDGLVKAAVTPGRLAATADVAAAMLTPCAVRRRRARRPASPEAEFVASATRGAQWGLEDRKRSARQVRHANSSSPSASPAASGDDGGATVAAHGASSVPPCAVNQLIAALRAFWTPARTTACMDAIDSVLPDEVPSLADAISRAAARPDTRPSLLSLFDRIEAAVPARRVAEVAAAMASGATPERAAYVGAVLDAVLPPKRLEGALQWGIKTLAASEPAPDIQLPSEATLSRTVSAAAALATSPRTPEWIDALCGALPPERLGAWTDAVAAALTTTDRQDRFLRVVAGLMGPTRDALLSSLLALSDAGRPRRSIPLPPDPADLAAAAAVLDTALRPSAVTAWVGLADALLTSQRHVEGAAPAAGQQSNIPQSIRIQAALPPKLSVPPLARALLLSAVRSGIAVRAVTALAAAVGEPRGRAAAVALVDAATAPAASAWRERLAAAPAALQLAWSFHINLLLVT